MGAIKAKFAPTLVPQSLLGVASGVATLDATGKLLTAQIPSGIAGTRKKERFVLAAADITNGYVTLSQTPLANSVDAAVQGDGIMEEQTSGSTGDYTIATAKLTWINDFASGGATPLAAGDVIFVKYVY